MLGQPHMLQLLHSFTSKPGIPIRFMDLQSRLEISPKTLSQRLKTLVGAGFLTRKAYNEIPPRVEYEPTAKAGELDELFRVLQDWSNRNSLRAVPMVSTVGAVRY